MQIQPNEPDSLIYLEYNLDPQFPASIFKHLHSPNSFMDTCHYHNCLELGYCYEGEGLFFVDNKVFSFTKGNVSVIFQDQVHIAQSAQKNKSVWRFLMIDPEKLLNACFSEYWQEIALGTKGTGSFPNIIPRENDPQIADMVYMLFEILLAEEENYRMAAKGLMLALMSKLSDRAGKYGDTGSNEKTKKSDPGFLKILPALNHISRNYANEISVSVLAQLCNTSVTSFRRNFLRTMKLSPMEYIHKTRVRMAKVLLASTDDKILEIALSTGYNSISTFNRDFLKETGISPRQWRKSKGAWS